MGLLSKIGGYVGRGAAAVATGGASEAYRAATGKADPYTAYQEKLGTSLGGKVENAAGMGSPTPNPLADETPEQKAARMRAEGASNVANGYRDRTLAAPDVAPRTAPVVSGPTPIRSARVGAAPLVTGPAPVASTFDPTQANETRAAQAAYLDRLHGVENGTAPSAAVDAMKLASARNVAGAFALAGSKGGYGGYAAREAQRQANAAGQTLVTQVGQQRAAEAADARSLEGGALSGMRGQDLATATTGADLSLRANQGNQAVGLDVERANQATKLQTQLTQAGFDQNTIMHMSDQELQTKLANAGYHLNQEQIDDLRAQNQATNRQNAINGATGAANDVANRDAQIRMARAQLQLAIQQNDQKKQDAALQMLAQLGAAYATGGASEAAGAAGGDAIDVDYVNSLPV